MLERDGVSQADIGRKVFQLEEKSRTKLLKEEWVCLAYFKNSKEASTAVAERTREVIVG